MTLCLQGHEAATMTSAGHNVIGRARKHPCKHTTSDERIDTYLFGKNHTYGSNTFYVRLSDVYVRGITHT